MSTIKYTQTDVAKRYNDIRKEYPAVIAFQAVTGALHFGLTLAAEAVLFAEAKGTEKITKGAITYAEAKAHRTLVTTENILAVKSKVNDWDKKLKEAQAKAKAKAAARALESKNKMSIANYQRDLNKIEGITAEHGVITINNESVLSNKTK